ncbi:MAG TPA: family 43 glycosylhydrolase [Mycobacteriales bacterium]|nr:family 43 glycosylhydrolase [Mycobacteriales bacterium]
MRSLRLWMAATAAAALVLGLGAPASAAPPLVNPVSSGFADTFADPSVVRGDDGAWYAFATSDPLRSGTGTPALIPTARSTDLVTWTSAGSVFSAANRPAWATPTSGLWAPDIRRLGDRWLLYYVVTDTTLNEGDDSAIGVATAPSPAGPWTDSGGPVVAPRPADGGGFLWTFDPAQVTGPDGRHYLFYGSYFGGIFGIELSADGLHTVGAATRIAIDNRYEGAYVIRHGDWYYLMASAANCCAGPTTGYSVFAGRSRSPLGPYVDANGVSLNQSRVGGTPVVSQNGNRWIGAGHNAVVTDLAGQDWFAYHAIDRNNPYLDEPFGINRRPMLLDRLDWIGGWPVVRAGAGPSDGPTTPPVTASLPAGTALPADVRVRGHVGAHAAVAFGPAAGVVLSGRTLAVVSRAGVRSLTLPTGYDPAGRHELDVRVAGRTLTVSVTDAGLADPYRTLTAQLPVSVAGTRVLPAGITDLTVAPLARPVTRPLPRPRPGATLTEDDFTGTALDPAWQWVRQDPQATVAGGVLSWPTEAADLTGTGNDAGVLLRAAPAGDYLVETKVHLDLGVDTVRNFEQAGLVAYQSDDSFVRVGDVAIWNTRQVEFGKEMPFAGSTSYGGTLLGPPGPTTWLRLAHTVDRATGEHRFRAASSPDGQHWTWGGTWTLPAGPAPRIGLVSHGGNVPPVTAAFDYFRVSTLR